MDLRRGAFGWWGGFLFIAEHHLKHDRCRDHDGHDYADHCEFLGTPPKQSSDRNDDDRSQPDHHTDVGEHRTTRSHSGPTGPRP